MGLSFLCIRIQKVQNSRVKNQLGNQLVFMGRRGMGILAEADGLRLICDESEVVMEE